MVQFHKLGGFLLVRYSNIVPKTRRFQIFDFKNVVTLKSRVRGHLRSLKVVPFDRLCMVSYPIVTLSLRCTVFEIFDFKNAVTLKTGLRVREGH